MVHSNKKRFSMAAVALFILCSPLMILENQGLSVTGADQVFYTLTDDRGSLLRLSQQHDGAWLTETVNVLATTGGVLENAHGLTADHATGRVLIWKNKPSGVEIFQLDVLTALADSLLTVPGATFSALTVHSISGELVGYSAKENVLYFIDPTGGRFRRVFTSGEKKLQDIVFEHGMYPVLYALTEDSTLCTVSLSDGRIQPVRLDPRARKLRALDFVPGVGLVALGEKLYRLDPETGRIRVISATVQTSLHGLVVQDRSVQSRTQVVYWRSRKAEDGALLEWMTDKEVHNLGFWIVRKDLDTGEYQQVTPRLIHGQGNSNGRREYSYLDRTVQQESRYAYYLVDVSFDGPVARYGPVVPDGNMAVVVR